MPRRLPGRHSISICSKVRAQSHPVTSDDMSCLEVTGKHFAVGIFWEGLPQLQILPVSASDLHVKGAELKSLRCIIPQHYLTLHITCTY